MLATKIISIHTGDPNIHADKIGWQGVQERDRPKHPNLFFKNFILFNIRFDSTVLIGRGRRWGVEVFYLEDSIYHSLSMFLCRLPGMFEVEVCVHGKNQIYNLYTKQTKIVKSVEIIPSICTVVFLFRIFWFGTKQCMMPL